MPVIGLIIKSVLFLADTPYDKLMLSKISKRLSEGNTSLNNFKRLPPK